MIIILLSCLVALHFLLLFFWLKEAIRRKKERMDETIIESNYSASIPLIVWIAWFLLTIPLMVVVIREGKNYARDLPLLSLGALWQAGVFFLTRTRVRINMSTGQMDIYRLRHFVAMVDDIVLVKTSYLGTWVYSADRLLFYNRLDNESTKFYQYIIEQSKCMIDRGDGWIANEATPFLSYVKIEEPFLFEYDAFVYAISFEDGCNLFLVNDRQWELLQHFDTYKEMIQCGQINGHLIHDIYVDFNVITHQK